MICANRRKKMFVKLILKMTLISTIIMFQTIEVIIYYTFMQLMNQNIFNILVTVYIGISALIIALGIFAMDKDNIDKRNIFKITLIKNSNIEKLMNKTVHVFLLILIQILIPITILVFIFRLLIFIMTVQLILMISKSFIKVINIITNEDEKQKYVNQIFIENIEKFNKEMKVYNNIIEKSKIDFNNHFLKDGYLSYDNYSIFDFGDHYNSIYSGKEGRIKIINFESIKILNNKIKNYVEKNINNKIDVTNKDFCIFRKVEGEKVNKGEPIIDIRKELEPLNIKYEDFFIIEDIKETEKKVIENQIIDVCQIYVDNINTNNIYGIKKSQEEFIILYKTLIKNNAIYFLDILRENIQDFFSKFKYNTDISFEEICYKLYFLAVEKRET
jgi:hypothetical protein